MRNGFTLSEAIILIFMFFLLMTALFSAIFVLYKSQFYTFQQSLAVSEARRGMAKMIKEIREAQMSETGSFLIEKASDKEFVFFADVDNDGRVERVRYFLGNVNAGQETKECTTTVSGGSCSVSFANFLKGSLISAQVKISLQGDFDHNNNEYAEIFVDQNKIVSDLCKTHCTHCPSIWEGTRIFDITNYAQDNEVIFEAKASPNVGPECGISPKYAMKARFEFSFSEDISALVHQFKRGVIKPVEINGKIEYPLEQEEISVITFYVRNNPPIFYYFDKDGKEISDPAKRLTETRTLRVLLVVNVDPNRPPKEFELESFVHLRNLLKE